jgi:hypothetical protein
MILIEKKLTWGRVHDIGFLVRVRGALTPPSRMDVPVTKIPQSALITEKRTSNATPSRPHEYIDRLVSVRSLPGENCSPALVKRMSKKSGPFAKTHHTQANNGYEGHASPKGLIGQAHAASPSEKLQLYAANGWSTRPDHPQTHISRKRYPIGTRERDISADEAAGTADMPIQPLFSLPFSTISMHIPWNTWKLRFSYFWQSPSSSISASAR